MKYAGILFAMAILICTGCAHVISDESMRLVDQSISFAMLRENPDKYIGRYVLLGGSVASLRNDKHGSRIEIVQFELNIDDSPDPWSHSGGRFLAETPTFIDPYVFKSNRLVTVVGEVKGHKTLPLGEIDYDYPVLAIREIHYWKMRDVAYYPYPYYYPPYPYYYWW
jgi:outer membrane lipoprotein